MNFALMIAGLMLASCGGDAFAVGLDDAGAVDAAATDLRNEPVADAGVAEPMRVQAAVEPEAAPSCSPFPSTHGQPPCLPCGGCAPQLVPTFFWVINPNSCGAGFTSSACKDCREHYTCECLRDAGEIAADAECELTDGGILTVWQ